MMKEDFSDMHPGTRGEYDAKNGWSLENEIEWTENFIKGLEMAVEHQDNHLKAMYLQRRWWVRFLQYCNSNATWK